MSPSMIAPFDLLLAGWAAWAQDDLPLLNTRIEQQQTTPVALVAALRPWIQQLHEQLDDMDGPLDTWEARRLIQLVGFGVSSLEKHYQDRGYAAGYGLAQLPDVERLLMQLAVIAKHPPRDTHYTYWLWNNDSQPLTFTGDSQEAFFNQVVNLTHALHTAACDALRPLSYGTVSLTAPSGLEALQYAAANIKAAYEHFRAFMVKGAEGQRSMEPAFFMTRMRTYLPTYPVQGVTWGGVNAANLAAQMQLDYRIGTIDGEYANTVYGRLRYLTVEDQQAVEWDMELPSLAEVFLRRLRLSAAAVLECAEGELARHLAAQAAPMQQALVAYRALVVAAANLTAMHWALIQNYLVKPAEKLSVEAKASMAVRPDIGTGGKSHAETEAIMHMRRRHPLVGKLIGCVEA